MAAARHDAERNWRSRLLKVAVCVTLLGVGASGALGEAAAPLPGDASGQAGAAPNAGSIAGPAAADAPPEERIAPTAPLGPPDKRIAKDVFGAAATPASLAAKSIGFYSRGCLAGARMLPIDGSAWQAMRLSRNRNWGHPSLIALVERLAKEAQAGDGWHGLLVGDLSQPRGGPMRTGHASHQIGLDADIWLTPMPDRRLSEKEREDMSAIDMLGPDKLSVEPTVWTRQHALLIRRAASYPEVERILVHPGIKKALCVSDVAHRSWLSKVRPYWGHNYHFHVRMACPPGNAACQPQPLPSGDDGCGKELDDWFKLLTAPPQAERAVKAPLTVDQLPLECRVVVDGRAPAATGSTLSKGATATSKSAPPPAR